MGFELVHTEVVISRRYTFICADLSSTLLLKRGGNIGCSWLLKTQRINTVGQNQSVVHMVFFFLMLKFTHQQNKCLKCPVKCSWYFPQKQEEVWNCNETKKLSEEH